MQSQQHQRPQQQPSRTPAAAKQTMMTKPSAPAVPATPLRIKTPIDAWGEDTDDHTKRSTYTATTQETAASSTAFSEDEGSSSAAGQGKAASTTSTSSPRANLLMKMLAKEMAATLLREGSLGGEDDGLEGDILGLVHLHHNQAKKGLQRRSATQDEDSDDDCSEGGIGASSASASVTASSSYLGSLESEDFDVESVVQMVVASVQKQQKQQTQKQHKAEHPSPRSAKPPTSSSTRHYPQQSPRKQQQPQAPSSHEKKSLTPDALLSPSSHHTIQTKTSELSLGSGSRAKAAQMDIWHPDFWALQEGGAPQEERPSGSTAPAAPAAAAVIEDLRPVNDPERFDDDFEDADDDNDEDDDVSVLSDISGLTDAWNLDGLRKRGHGSRGAHASTKKVGGGGGLASLLFGGNSSSHSRKTKSNSYDGATKSSYTTDASSIIGSHVAGTSSSAGDSRSVSTRRSKSSLSSGGTSKSKAKAKTRGQARQQPCTPSTKSVSSSASSSKRSRAAGSRSSNMPPAKTVAFSTVHVREYERILCDNPATSAGLSVGIGWQFVDVATTTNTEDEDDNDNSSTATMTVDAWELRQKRGRSQSELLLSRRERETIVRQWGCTDREITAMKRELNKCRAQRRQTVNNLGAQKVEEAVESVRSKVKSLLFLQARDDRGGGVGAGNTATLVSI
jgi:hypothetical protein